MAIYNAYLEGAEREAAILEMELDNQYEKLSMLYEMSLMELNQIKKDLELKVFKESGTYDDLEYLISEAEEQAGQDQKNILSQILDWFSRAIQKMVTSIRNFFTGAKNVPDDSEVDAPDEFFDADKDGKASSILKMLQGIDANSTPNFFETSLGKILGVGVAAGSIFVINRAVSKSKKVKAKAIKDEVKKAEGMEGQLNAVVTKIKQVLDSAANLPIIGQFCTTAKGILDNTVKPISDWLQDKINWGAELLKTNTIVQGAANTINQGIDAAKNQINKTLHGNKTQKVNDVVGVTSATPEANNTRIKVAYVDKSSGKDEPKRTTVNLSGQVMDKNIPAKVRQGIQNSEAVKNALAAINTANQKANEKAVKAAPVNNAQTQTQTPAQPVTASAEDLQLELGDNYTVEVAEDGAIEINLNTVIEMPEDYLSTTESIFGMVAEEEASEDPELEELQKLFEEF